ncbi:MAG: hypothetical protein RR268_07245, partial [Kiritimatiellia bacterium]
MKIRLSADLRRLRKEHFISAVEKVSGKMTFGKRIQLFLVDGTPNGRWICELSNWTGIAYKL